MALTEVVEQQRRDNEYCAPVWCRTAHTRLIDPAINDAWMPSSYASGQPSYSRRIQPAELRCKGATLSLARCAMEPGHQLHSALTCPASENGWRLKLTRCTTAHQFN